MDEILSWEECRRKHIRQVPPDIRKASYMYSLIKIRLVSLKNQTDSFLKLETYYEIIKELISAIMSLKGLKSFNHECVVSYFQHTHPGLLIEAKKLHELKNIRNDLQYEGKLPRENYLSENEEYAERLIKILEKELLEELGIP